MLCLCKCESSSNTQKETSIFSLNSFDFGLKTLPKPSYKIPTIRISQNLLKNITIFKPDDKNLKILYKTTKNADISCLKIAKLLGLSQNTRTFLVLKPTKNFVIKNSDTSFLKKEDNLLENLSKNSENSLIKNSLSKNSSANTNDSPVNSSDTPSYKLFCLKIIRKSTKTTFPLINSALSLQKPLENPFLPRISSIFEGKNHIYFLNEYVSGGPFLELFLSKNSCFNEVFISFISAEILLAIEYLHKDFGIFANIKPNNVHLSSKGHISLLDSGVFTEGNWQNSRENAIFSAPELFKGEKHDFLCDFWSFGIFLAVILTGVFPYEITDEISQIAEKAQKNEFLMIKSEKISGFAKELLKGLLTANREKRLGFNGVEEVKKMGFFQKVDWDLLRKMKIASPFVKNCDKKEKEKLSQKNENSVENCEKNRQKNEKSGISEDSAIMSSMVYFLQKKQVFFGFFFALFLFLLMALLF